MPPPEEIVWIDLSFNGITHVDEVLSHFFYSF